MPAQFIAPPIATVLVWGVFWRRGTAQAGTFTLLFGFLAGFIIFLFDMGFAFLGGVQYVSDPVHGLGIPFLLQAWWYFCILSVVYVAVSLMTPPPKAEQIDGLTWDSPFAFLARSEIRGDPGSEVDCGGALRCARGVVRAGSVGQSLVAVPTRLWLLSELTLLSCLIAETTSRPVVRHPSPILGGSFEET